MYSVNPAYDIEQEIEIPSCIYKIQKLTEDNDLPNNTIDNLVDFSTCESHYGNINDRLVTMTKRIDSLISRLEDSPRTTISKPPTSTHERPIQSRSIAIYLNPMEKLPSSLVCLVDSLASKGLFHRIRVYRHSSVRKLTCHMPDPFSDMNVVASDKKLSSLDFIYRDVDYATLIESASSYEVQGVASLLRYFGRMVRPAYDLDSSVSAQIDFYIDAASILLSGDEAERVEVEKFIRKTVDAKSTRLVGVSGDGASLADLSVYGAFKDSGICTDGELQKWAQCVRKTFNIS